MPQREGGSVGEGEPQERRKKMRFEYARLEKEKCSLRLQFNCCAETLRSAHLHLGDKFQWTQFSLKKKKFSCQKPAGPTAYE